MFESLSWAPDSIQLPIVYFHLDIEHISLIQCFYNFTSFLPHHSSWWGSKGSFLNFTPQGTNNPWWNCKSLYSSFLFNSISNFYQICKIRLVNGSISVKGIMPLFFILLEWSSEAFTWPDCYQILPLDSRFILYCLICENYPGPLIIFSSWNDFKLWQ